MLINFIESEQSSIFTTVPLRWILCAYLYLHLYYISHNTSGYEHELCVCACVYCGSESWIFGI